MAEFQDSILTEATFCSWIFCFYAVKPLMPLLPLLPIMSVKKLHWFHDEKTKQPMTVGINIFLSEEREVCNFHTKTRNVYVLLFVRSQRSEETCSTTGHFCSLFSRMGRRCL